MQDYDPRSEKEPGIKGEMPRSRETRLVVPQRVTSLSTDRPSRCAMCAESRSVATWPRLCAAFAGDRSTVAAPDDRNTEHNRTATAIQASEPCSVVAVHSSIISPTSIRLVLSFTTPTISRLSQCHRSSQLMEMVYLRFINWCKLNGITSTVKKALNTNCYIIC